jgi:hypothetical protein
MIQAQQKVKKKIVFFKKNCRRSSVAPGEKKLNWPQ